MKLTELISIGAIVMWVAIIYSICAGHIDINPDGVKHKQQTTGGVFNAIVRNHNP